MEPHRIIIVDDSQLTLQITKDLLEKEGVEVCTASSGFDVSKVITAGRKPSLMLIDVTMPHINGDALVKVLKTNSVTKGIPIFFYSSRPEIELQTMVATSGADGYFTKSLSPAELIKAIEKLLSSAAQSPT